MNEVQKFKPFRFYSEKELHLPTHCAACNKPFFPKKPANLNPSMCLCAASERERQLKIMVHIFDERRTGPCGYCQRGPDSPHHPMCRLRCLVEGRCPDCGQFACTPDTCFIYDLGD